MPGSVQPGTDSEVSRIEPFSQNSHIKRQALTQVDLFREIRDRRDSVPAGRAPEASTETTKQNSSNTNKPRKPKQERGVGASGKRKGSVGAWVGGEGNEGGCYHNTSYPHTESKINC